MLLHILPINDIKPHEDTTTCHCNPSVEVTDSGDMMVIHNSFDGRENYEKKQNKQKKAHGTQRNVA